MDDPLLCNLPGCLEEFPRFYGSLLTGQLTLKRRQRCRLVSTLGALLLSYRNLRYEELGYLFHAMIPPFGLSTALFYICFHPKYYQFHRIICWFIVSFPFCDVIYTQTSNIVWGLIAMGTWGCWCAFILTNVIFRGA